MELVHSKIEVWEQKRLRENVFNRLLRKRIVSLFFSILVFILLFDFIFKVNTLPFFKDDKVLYLNWLFPFLIFHSLTFIIKHVRIYIDLTTGTKKTILTKIDWVFSFLGYKIVLYEKMRILVIKNIHPYFLSVNMGKKLILKISKTYQLIDFYVIDENEVVKGDLKSKDYTSITLDKNELEDKGYLTLPSVYSLQEIKSMIECMNIHEIDMAPSIKKRTLILYKSFFKKNLEMKKIVMNDNLKSIVNQLFGDGYFIINSMYFDKPGRSTWGVPYHQDRQIIVAEKKVVNGFNEWFNDFGLLTVRATNEVLQQIYTIRIHFDETNLENGSLQVIESSHKQGVFDPSLIDKSKEVNCNVPVGGVMIMSPLLMHQSLASSSDAKRRVIHFDITNVSLPGGLSWGEKETLIG